MQLDPEAPPGLIATVASERGLPLTIVQPGIDLPADILSAAAGLIVLGSAAAAVDPAGAAAALVRAYVRDDRPLLALDAAAPLLALAIGGEVRAGGSHKFGYVDVVPTAATAADPLLRALGGGLPLMEWHDDAIELPGGVPVLARCERERVQAFRAGRAAYGLRFHPGATAAIVRRWAALRGAASNNPAIRVRLGAEIIRHQDRAERFGRAVIEAWLDRVGGR
jgi:GMP synthase-like glutamine amidotransferase